jgi:hypothetical protein
LDLKKGRVQTNQLGLPIGISGNFAVVYQLQSGERVFAVRCFIRPVTDQQQRYSALSRHLSGLWLPSLVDFTYLPEGILVRGQWYPVVRMEWVSGRQLHRYVEDNLGQGQILERLAAQWRGVVAGLKGAHMAHGDLQHGNILVNGQGIRLVDYDGLFIPALRGNPPGEVGHPNYQHPERIQKGYYEENADAFSALVIYLSLLSLRADPGLWTFHNGENLIFLADDFKNPGRTLLWDRLKKSPDTEVQRLTAELEEFCQKPVSEVPDLETVLQRLPEGLAPRRVVPTPVPRPTPVTVTCPKCGQANNVQASSANAPKAQQVPLSPQIKPSPILKEQKRMVFVVAIIAALLMPLILLTLPRFKSDKVGRRKQEEAKEVVRETPARRKALEKQRSQEEAKRIQERRRKQEEVREAIRETPARRKALEEQRSQEEAKVGRRKQEGVKEVVRETPARRKVPEEQRSQEEAKRIQERRRKQEEVREAIRETPARRKALEKQRSQEEAEEVARRILKHNLILRRLQEGY